MLVPVSHQAALLLLFISLVFLGSWANMLKLTGPRWRFELFYFDFAAGALSLSLVAAFTLGSVGSELSFNDRIAVAGLRSQAFAIAAGFIFNVGNMLLVAAVSLIGMAAAFPLALGLAFLVGLLLDFHGASFLLLGLGALLLLVSAGSAVAATRQAITAKKPIKGGKKRARKALVAAIVGGVLIGVSAAVAKSGLWGDLGLGAYAGLLMFCLGLVISTAIFNLFFMNIGIEGGRVTFGDYLAGSHKQHLFGLIAGMLWAGGTLCSLLAQPVMAGEPLGHATMTIFTQGFVLLALLWGWLGWREFANSSRLANALLAVSALSFAGGMLLVAFQS